MGQRRLQLREQGFDPIDDLDDIGPRLALNVHNHRRRFVGPSGKADILGIVLGIGHLGQPHRTTIAVGDDQAPIIRRRPNLVIGINDRGTGRPVEHALGLVHIGTGDGHPQVFQAHAIRSQRIGVGPDAHGRPLTAADADQPNPRQLRYFLRQAGIDQILHLEQRQGFRTDSQGQDRRIRRVDLVVNGRHRQVGGQKAGGGINGGLDGLFGDIQI